MNLDKNGIFFFILKKGDQIYYMLCVSLLAGKSKAGLKSAATSVQQQIHKHAVASGDKGDIQR